MAHDSFYSILAVMNLLPPNIQDKRILDVGFGSGTVVHQIVSYSVLPWSSFKGMPYIIGIDKDKEIVEFTKKWIPYYREIYLQDITEIPYPSSAIKDLDIIICTEVVEHTTDKEKTLKMIEYFKTIAPLVIMTCPNGDDTNKLYDKEWHNHNTIWQKEDFTKLGFNVRLETKYSKSVEIFLRIVKRLATDKPLYRTIVAWYTADTKPKHL